MRASSALDNFAYSAILIPQQWANQFNSDVQTIKGVYNSTQSPVLRLYLDGLIGQIKESAMQQMVQNVYYSAIDWESEITNTWGDKIRNAKDYVMGGIKDLASNIAGGNITGIPSSVYNFISGAPGVWNNGMGNLSAYFIGAATIFNNNIAGSLSGVDYDRDMNATKEWISTLPEEQKKQFTDALNNGNLNVLVNYAITDDVNKKYNNILNNPNVSVIEKYNTLKNYWDSTYGLFTGTSVDDALNKTKAVLDMVKDATGYGKSVEQKRADLLYLKENYAAMVAQVPEGLIPLSGDLFKDLGLSENPTDEEIYNLYGDLTDDDADRAINMAFQADEEYERALNNYNDILAKNNPENIKKEGMSYGDVLSKYNGQKVDEQAEQTARGMGASGAVATNLGNMTQYQNYATNLEGNITNETNRVEEDLKNQLSNAETQTANAESKYGQAMENLNNQFNKKYGAQEAELQKKAIENQMKASKQQATMDKANVAMNAGSGIVNAVKGFLS